ncbi:hypothetical protein PsorP6_017651 [Peronosclerospora sorghi]|uniref:Uncharacterized protein n=1 Tax=Peronosclerospora sorghi TaxID=230839 RepID=A0ACC0WM25_9STRA|nr:hypothetical protein PsorP6_017651 [Peronosclerospora sorghi]
MQLARLLVVNAVVVLVATTERTLTSAAHVRGREQDSVERQGRAADRDDVEERMALPLATALTSVTPESWIPRDKTWFAFLRSMLDRLKRLVLREPPPFQRFLDKQSEFDRTFTKRQLEKQDTTALVTDRNFQSWLQRPNLAGGKYPQLEKLATLVKTLGKVRTAHLIEEGRKTTDVVMFNRKVSDVFKGVESTQFEMWQRDVGDVYDAASKIFGKPYRQAREDASVEAILTRYVVLFLTAKTKVPQAPQAQMLQALDKLHFDEERRERDPKEHVERGPCRAIMLVHARAAHEKEHGPDGKEPHEREDRVHDDRGGRVRKQRAVGRKLEPHEHLKRGDREDHPRVLSKAPARGVRNELIVLPRHKHRRTSERANEQPTNSSKHAMLDAHLGRRGNPEQKQEQEPIRVEATLFRETQGREHKERVHFRHEAHDHGKENLSKPLEAREDFPVILFPPKRGKLAQRQSHVAEFVPATPTGPVVLFRLQEPQRPATQAHAKEIRTEDIQQQRVPPTNTSTRSTPSTPFTGLMDASSLRGCVRTYQHSWKSGMTNWSASSSTSNAMLRTQQKRQSRNMHILPHQPVTCATNQMLVTPRVTDCHHQHVSEFEREQETNKRDMGTHAPVY